MSVTINLLPDVRLARIRAQHLRHLVTGISVAIWIVAGIIVGGLLLGIGAQKLAISNVNNQIASDTSQIQATSGLNNALTAQQTLQSLPALYANRTYFSKFVPLIVAAMPTNLTVSNVATDSNNLLTVSGKASSAYAVDQFYQAIQASGAKTAGGANFSNVTLNDVSKDDNGVASFTLTATVSPGALHGQN